MKVAAFQYADGQESFGLVMDHGLMDLSAVHQIRELLENRSESHKLTTILQFLETGFFTVEHLRKLQAFAEKHHLVDKLTVKEYTLLAPIKRPPAIYALGRNFPAHALESGDEIPSEPIVFGKAVTSVIGPEEPVVYKKWLTRVDPEAELAVVIGKKGSNIPESEAADYIAGYTAMNDVTARDIQKEDLAAGKPWLRSKGLDTFGPMGPWIVLPDEIKMPVELTVEMRVNGETRQKDNTSVQTFKIPFMIHWISQYHTLVPGDIISTGTPEGMKPVFPGDIMEVFVEQIGILRNPVAAEE